MALAALSTGGCTAVLAAHRAIIILGAPGERVRREAALAAASSGEINEPRFAEDRVMGNSRIPMYSKNGYFFSYMEDATTPNTHRSRCRESAGPHACGSA